MTNRSSQHDEALERARALGHEHRDISVKGILLSGLSLLLLIASSLAFTWWFLGFLSAPERPLDPGRRRPVVSVVDQKVNQQLVRIRQQAEQQHILQSYGWIDREAGIARIPIERAIEITAAQGESGLKPERNDLNESPEK